jgi:hypothetical protein
LQGKSGRIIPPLPHRCLHINPPMPSTSHLIPEILNPPQLLLRLRLTFLQ